MRTSDVLLFTFLLCCCSLQSNKPLLIVQILTTIALHTLTTLIHLSCLSHFHLRSPPFKFLPWHTHTMLPHQGYILLKRVSEAERPITLTRTECQKKKKDCWEYGGRVKSNGRFSDFNCKCLIAPIIMSNKTHPVALILNGWYCNYALLSLLYLTARNIFLD